MEKGKNHYYRWIIIDTYTLKIYIFKISPPKNTFWREIIFLLFSTAGISHRSKQWHNNNK